MHKLIRPAFAVVAVTAIVLLTVTAAKAQEPFPWINSSLSFQKGTDTSAVPTSLNSNVDCQMQDSITCSVPTAYGAAAGGIVRLNGTSSYRPVISYIDNRQHFLPVPNSSTFITYTTEPPYGFYLYFNYNFASSVTRVTVFGGGVQYKINRGPDSKLADKANHRLAADYGSMNFSQNSQWMIISQPNVAMLRVNLQTFEVVPFANGFNYTIGIDPAIRTAISNDGRYAAVSSKGFSSFKIYDLNTCTAVPDTINGPVACQSRDLKDFINQQLPGYGFSSNLKFISTNVLSSYSTYFVGSDRKTAKVIIGASNDISNQLELLGMGESYISGEGAFNYQAGTDTSDNECHLSLVSYPYLVGHDLNYNSYNSVACSGALIDDINNSTSAYRGQAQNREIARSSRTQQEIDSIFASFKPGYVNQSDFVDRYQPKTILISIGGNDIGFSKIVTRCGVPWEFATCYSSYEDRLELVREINNRVFPKLVRTYQTIKNAGAHDARIYVVGYPQIAKPDGNCALNVHLRQEEIIFSKQLVGYFNSVIKLAAAKAGVRYIDTENALNGHRLCEAKYGSVAINGLTLGNDLPTRFGPIGNESYHPNDLGHQLLENKILASTHNLTDPMPAAVLNSAPPSENGLEILNAPRSGRAVSNTQYDQSITHDALFPQLPADLFVDGAQHSLNPSAPYRVELHSSPVVLGTFMSDSSSNLNSQIQIPANTAPGNHTLHIYGANLAGDLIDIYKTIYVGASASDYDGDGILNATDTCMFVEPSGEDYDQDGIDDACDGNITEAPPAPVNLPAPSTSTPPENQTTLNPTIVPLVQIQPTAASSQGFVEILQAQSTSVAIQNVPSGSLNQTFPQSSQLVITTTSSPTPVQPANANTTISISPITSSSSFDRSDSLSQQKTFQKPVVLGATMTKQPNKSMPKITAGLIVLTIVAGLGLGVSRKRF